MRYEVMDEMLHQAKLALPTGGVPYSHRLSLRTNSPRQSLSLKGGLART
jgi:hypothetical protein